MKRQYPLGATCFSRKQCNKIQAQYLPTFLYKMGINRTTSTAVRHGPHTLGGMDIFHLETEQAVQHIKLLVSHLRHDDDIGWMIQTSIDCLQLQAGTSWSVMSRAGKKVRQYTDPCYASQTWEFLDGINSHVLLEPKTWMHPQRTGDSFIMEDAANIVGVTTCANITNSAGNALCKWALNATSNPRQSMMCFPRQERPSASNVFATWKQVIRTCYSAAAFRTLDRPMGPWHKGKIAQVWNTTVINPNTGIVHIW
jgi:hypothetical protein